MTAHNGTPLSRREFMGLDIKDPGVDEPGQGSGLNPRPENYAFVAGNILQGLPFPVDSFDFVHQRLRFFAVPGDRWQFVVNELVRVTRPGAGLSWSKVTTPILKVSPLLVWSLPPAGRVRVTPPFCEQ
jgi:hypothetical protein